MTCRSVELRYITVTFLGCVGTVCMCQEEKVWQFAHAVMDAVQYLICKIIDMQHYYC